MKIKIEGRELDFPQLETLTFRETGLIKKATGLTMGQYEAALENGDPDMIMALAIVAKYRADGDVDLNAMLDVPIMEIEISADDEVEEAPEVPPADAAAEAAADDPALD